ncbi:MAG: MerR family transcriptional regulator [Anaerolineae bacterium]|nr:MerR family transcriptional regulator [Anaerolineae bacterium]
MIKIGDFARLGQVSVVTLRHYDDIGLLKPVSVDSFTGYRYYSVAQLAALNRILALKDLGFSLEQIEQVLNGLTIDQLRGMLKMKQAEVEQQLAQEQERLARIAARLKQIELEDHMPDYDVVLKNIPAILIASRTVTIPTNDQVPAYLSPAYKEVYSHIKAQGGKDTGPCFAVWHQPAAVLANEVAEAAVPIDRLLSGTDLVKVYELPSAQVVSAVHHGDFENFTQLHAVLLSWIEANGYRVLGTYREIYINHDKSNLSDSATEIQYPVEKAT